MPQVHEPGGFSVDASYPNRQQCWDMLGDGVRNKLVEKAGTALEWWARRDHEGHLAAVVFGPRGLCRASSVIRNDKRVYLVERLQLEPGAMRRQSFNGAAPKNRPSAASRLLHRTSSDDRAQQPLPGAHPLNLDEAARGILGNFPAEVQKFLQHPFLRDDRRVVADWYYEESVEFAQQRLFALFCLSADRNVTVASATRILPRGRSLDRAQWEIECYHAPARRV